MKAGTAVGGEPCVIDPATRPFCLVIFGASGDLTKRKLIPAVFSLYTSRLLPKRFAILGSARTRMNDDDFRSSMKENVGWDGEVNRDEWEGFARNLFYFDIRYDDPSEYRELDSRINDFRKNGTADETVFYLATPPEVYPAIITNLGESGLAQRSGIVIEKPFGRDLDTARELNTLLHRYFNEDRIFRIDHYLAKETVQNILIFRFANSLFEPVWNRSQIDHVEITVAESLGIEQRAGYYEKAGVLRDMFQNHMLQLLALVAMEPPSLFTAEPIRSEKLKVLHALRPPDLDRLGDYLVLGQYAPGQVNGNRVEGYREEEDVSPGSRTPTFAALKVFIDNWRWQDVPFYLRTGKRLEKKSSFISVHFKKAPDSMFRNLPIDVLPNVLTFLIQPEEEIIQKFQAKIPGSKVCVKDVDMIFSYKGQYRFLSLEAYERVLLDCFTGDQILFVRQDGVEAAWKFFTPILRKIESDPRFPLYEYKAGDWGPEEAGELIHKDNRSWSFY